MQSTTNKMFDYPSIAATPELIFKMSKKIAQLTKVIYVVNLKNDLHHREVEEISNNFKLIIEQNNLQHKAEVLKLENYQKVLEEKNKNDVSQIQLDYHQRMGKMDQKYLENQKLWEIKWENAMNERQREITNFTSKLETLKNLLEQCQQEKKTNQSDHALQLEKYVSLASEFENATKILAGEKYLLENKIEAAEALHNERCKNMSENHQKEIETLKEKHYTDLCELQEGIRHQRALSDKKINEISTKLQEQCQQNDLLRKNVETLEAEKIRGKKKKEELENEMQHKLSALNAEVLELRKNSVQLLKEKSELNSEIERRGKENIELMMESKKQVEKLQNLLTSQRVEMNDETRHLLDTTTEKYEVKIEELKQRYEDLVIQFKNDKQAFENGILNKKIEIQSLSAKLLNLERNNITLLKEKDHEIISLKNKLEEQRQSLLENHELELKKIEFEAEKRIAELLSQNETLEKKLDHIFKEKENSVSKYTQNIDDLQASFNSKKNSWEKEKATLLESFNSKILTLSDAIEKNVACIETLETQLASTKSSEQKLSVELSIALQNVNKTEMNLKTLLEKESQYQKQVHHLESQYSALMESHGQLTTNYQNSTQKYELVLSELVTKSSILEDINQKLSAKEVQNDQLRSQLDKVSAELKKNLVELLNLNAEKKVFEDVSLDLKMKLDHMSKQLLLAGRREEEIKLDFETALKEHSNKGSQIINALESRIVKLEAELNSEKQTSAEMLVSVQNEKENETRKKLNALAAEKEELQKNHENEVHCLKSMAEDLNRNLQREMDVSRQKGQLLCDLENRCTQVALLHETKLKEIQERFKTDAATTNELHTQTLEKVKKENLQTIQEMLSEFSAAQDFMKTQLENQDKRLKEAEIRYANREAREVDLVRINDLEVEIDRLNRKNNQLMEDLNRSRKEIQYREESLNRLFNTKPNVGLMNPLAKKSSSSSILGGSSPALRNNPPPLPPVASMRGGSEELINNKSRESSASTSRKLKS